ncbi:MAG TPA: SPFH domain-containing protein [Polyangia bacterium]|nr:SPFH domain-containing protein [Polyangia bacterium]
MGIMNFVKGGVQELAIARPDQAKGALVYKHPDPTIPNRARVTVGADEIALFFRDGKFVGQLDAGVHVLESSSIMFLDQLVDKFTGGNIFKAELWFVSMREITGLKFGGRIGAQEDPKSGVPVETMVHGDYSLKVIDPKQVILGLWGMKSWAEDAEFFGWFRDLLLKVIRDRVAELLVKKKWPLLDVTSGAFTEEIEEEVVQAVKRHIEPYGVQVVRLGNFVVAIKEEDEANLKKLYTDAAYVRMAGGLQGYQQFAAGKAMMGAGEGMAKGGDGGGAAATGAGLGVGFAMANMFAKQGQPQAQPPPAPQSAGQVACPACGAQVASGKFCAACGKPLAAAKKFCAQCGVELAAGARFCSGCGTPAA